MSVSGFFSKIKKFFFEFILIFWTFFEKKISWYTDALCSLNDPYDENGELYIIGQVPTEKRGISPKTDVHFLFQRYRYVFMFDFSSSAFRINDLTYELIVDELLNAFKVFVKELLVPFKGKFSRKISDKKLRKKFRQKTGSVTP